MTGGRTALEAPFFRFQLALALQHGEVYVAGEDLYIDGVALVFPPGKDFVQELVSASVSMASSDSKHVPLSA